MTAFVRGTFLRHLYTIFWGVFITFYLYGIQILIVLGLGLGTYFIMLLAPRKLQNFIVCVFLFVQLTYSHIQTFNRDPNETDLGITTVTLLIVLRLQSMSKCYDDGARPESDLNERQIKYRIVKLPAIYEVISFTFTHITASIGVFYEFKDYMDWVKLKEEY